MKPTAAPTNRIAMAPTIVARSHPRGRAAGASAIYRRAANPSGPAILFPEFLI